MFGRKVYFILCLLLPLLSAFSQGTWTQKANIGSVGRWAAGGFSIGNYGYITLGQNQSNVFVNDLWEYDPSLNTWTQKANFPGALRYSLVSLSIGNKGYIGCGQSSTGIFLNDFWEWDRITNTWTRKTNFPGQARYGALGLSIGNLGYVGLGWNGSSYFNDFWEYDPSTNNWIQKANYSGLGRVECGGFTIGNVGYVGSGSNPCSVSYNDFWEFNPSTNSWTAKASISGPSKQNPIGFSLCNHGYFGWGDHCGTPYNTDIYQYDPIANSWAQMANFPSIGRDNPIWFSINNKGYAGTGMNSSKLNDFWEFTPPTPCNTISITVTSQNILCNAQCTGTSTLNPVNGISPYTYNWSNGQTAQTATGLCAGTYSVLVTDASSATTSATVTITQPTALSAAAGSTSATCLSNNGSASVTVSGGTPGYTYSWNPTGQISQTATGLTAGTYSAIISDANGCTKTQTVSVTANNPLTVSTSSTQTGCAISNATANPTNGTAPYTYAWNPGGQTTQTATGLPAGTYSVSVTDPLGCSSSNTIAITSPPPLTHSFPPVTNVNCFGDSNGSATVSVSGGTPPYTYSWSSTPAQTSQTATSLSAGTYTVNVADSLGCIFSDTVVISSPLALSSSFSVTNVDCFGNNTGSASANISGGTPSYTYSWNSIPVQTTQNATGLYAGVFTVTITDSHGCSFADTAVVSSPTGLSVFSPVITNVDCFGNNTGIASVTATGGTPGYACSWIPTAQTTSTATGLAAGVYTVTITDNNGCIIHTLVSISQPTLLTSISTQTNILCFGSSGGTATVATAGGTPSYSYWWNNGQTTSTTTNLSSGTYTIVVSDANGCTLTSTVTLTQPFAPLTSSISSVNVLCNPNSTGSATATASGGTLGYTYLWMPNGQTVQNISNLAAGTYSLTITDANGCSDTLSITITQPSLLAAIITSDTSICSGTNATDSILVSGGTPGYTYLWMPGGQTSAAITVAPANSTTYTVQVTDANGCSTAQLNTTVNVFPSPVAAFLSSLDKCTRCLQLTDQSANAATWLWNFGDSSTSSQQNPIHCFSGEGVYNITLTVNSSPQCKNTFSFPDSVFGYELTPVIPNVFTPNGDGINDVFSISGLDKCSPYSIKIYDRWGILIFETEKTGFAWDGTTSAGIKAVEGVYYYVFTNSSTIQTGFVTLLR